MPLTLANYTDPAGNVYPASIWHVSELTIHPGPRVARITFAAHKDAQAVASGKQPIGGATKVYMLRDADFDAFRKAYMAAPNIEAVAEAHAIATADVHPPGTPVKPGEKPPAPVSFFAGATQS